MGWVGGPVFRSVSLWVAHTVLSQGRLSHFPPPPARNMTALDQRKSDLCRTAPLCQAVGFSSLQAAHSQGEGGLELPVKTSLPLPTCLLE